MTRLQILPGSFPLGAASALPAANMVPPAAKPLSKPSPMPFGDVDDDDDEKLSTNSSDSDSEVAGSGQFDTAPVQFSNSLFGLDFASSPRIEVNPPKKPSESRVCIA